MDSMPPHIRYTMKENDFDFFFLANVMSPEHDPVIARHCATKGNTVELPQDLVANPCNRA